MKLDSGGPSVKELRELLHRRIGTEDHDTVVRLYLHITVDQHRYTVTHQASEGNTLREVQFFDRTLCDGGSALSLKLCHIGVSDGERLDSLCVGAEERVEDVCLLYTSRCV